MVYKVTFTGIDGSGRSTTIDIISRKLSGDGLSVVHPYRPGFADLPNKEREYFFRRGNDAVDRLHEIANEHNQRTIVGLINVAYGVVQKFLERYAVRKYDPDIILVSRNPVLDPSVYSAYYFPFTRGLSPRIRTKIASLINHPRKEDLVLYMDIDPEIAHARILERLEKENGQVITHRRKFPHMHENPDDLRFLREQFEVTLDLLVREHGRSIERVDASKPQKEVVATILSMLDY